MSLADELAKLEELWRSGALSDSEFARAKAALLSAPSAGPRGGLMKTGTGSATDCSITGSEPLPVAVPVPVVTAFSSGQPRGPIGQPLPDRLAEVKHQNALAEIDREWEIERQQYLISGRYGRKCVPTTAAGMVTALGGGAFGLFWTIMALSMGRGMDAGPPSLFNLFFPLFGIVFTLMAIGFGLNALAKARQYQRAFAAYKARRTKVKGEPPR